MSNEQLSNEQIDRLKEIFVTRQNCDVRYTETNDHINHINIDIAKIGTKLSILIGILGAIGVAVLSVSVKLLLGA